MDPYTIQKIFLCLDLLSILNKKEQFRGGTWMIQIYSNIIIIMIKAMGRLLSTTQNDVTEEIDFRN